MARPANFQEAVTRASHLKAWLDTGRNGVPVVAISGQYGKKNIDALIDIEDSRVEESQTGKRTLQHEAILYVNAVDVDLRDTWVFEFLGRKWGIDPDRELTQAQYAFSYGKGLIGIPLFSPSESETVPPGMRQRTV